MYFAGKIACLNLLHAPLRTFLTCLAVIAAATMAAWTVASYDGLLRENASGQGTQLLGKYDYMLLAAPQLSEEHFRACLSRAGILSEVDLYQSIRVNVRTGAGEQRSVRTARGGRQESSGNRGGKPGRGEIQQPLSAPPPLQGLPRRTYLVLGTTAASPPLSLLSGRWLTSTAKDECVLSESVSRQLRVKIGDSLAVGSFAGSFILRIAGIISDTGEASRSAQELWQRLAPDFTPPSLNGLFVSPVTAREISGGGTSGLFAAVISTDAESTATIMQRLSAEPLRCVTREMLAVAAQTGSAEESRIKMQGWTACGIALLLSFFIICSSLSMGVSERIRQNGLLRAAALTRGQMCLSIIMESLFLGAAGWVGGLLAGTALLEFFSEAAVLRNPLSRGAAPFRAIGGWTIALTGICALAGSLAAAVLPAWRASRLRVLEAMSSLRHPAEVRCSGRLALSGLLLPVVNIAIILWPGIPEMTRVKLYGFVGCPLTVIGFALLCPGILQLCARLFAGPVAWLLRLPGPFLRAQLSANLWRGTGTCLSLSLGLGFYMMVVIWSASLLQPFLPGKWLPEMFVSIMPGGLNTSDLEKVRQIRGIQPDSCQPVIIEQVSLAEDLTGSRIHQNVVRQDNVTLMGIAAEAIFAPDPLLDFTFLSDRQAAEEQFRQGEDCCLVPSFFSELTGLGCGDTFQVLTPGGNEKVEYRIAGVIRLNGWHWFSKYSGTRRNFGRTAALLFVPAQSVASNFHLWRHNYYWFNTTGETSQESLLPAFQALAEANRGQSFPVVGGGESIVGQESIQITSTASLHQSIMGRTETIVSGMLRMPKLLLWIMSLAVANTALASIRVRRREMGIMRAVGLSGNALLRLLLGEAAVTGLAATLLSLGYGIFSGLCSAQMATHLTFFGGMGWNFALPWLAIAQGLLLTLTICLAAALVPAIIARCTSPLKLLQD
ncbi:MAG: FtsX-like permease family protein [Lentisphaerae bacterium]|nr:FtsX-like permease family protein [Lentisphaerota bacterium]